MAVSPFARYLQNPHYVDDVRWHVRQASVKTVPPEVLHAHWHSDDAYELLTELSTEYRIVPIPLAPFVSDCCSRKRDFLCFLHPETLFSEPPLARWVFEYLGCGKPDAEVLQLLVYLSSSDLSKKYRSHVESYLVKAFSSQAAVVCGAANMCALMMHYVEPTATLCLSTLQSMLLSRGVSARVHTLSLLGHLPQSTHAQLIDPIVWCAVYGYAQAARYVQDLSGTTHAARLAHVIQQFPHHFYVDRLHLVTLRLMIPYLIHYRAISSLMRLYEADRHAAIQKGILTALLSNRVKPLLLCWPVDENPSSMHDMVHFMYVKGTVPTRNLTVVDELMKYHLSALRCLLPNTSGLERRMQLTSNWYRRRVVLLMLLQGTTPLMQRLRLHEFAWRLVFAYL